LIALLLASQPSFAQATPPIPAAVIEQHATYATPLCPGDPIVLTLSFIDLSAESVDPYQVRIKAPIPNMTEYQQGDAALVHIVDAEAFVQWDFSVDPAQPSLIAPTASYTVVVGSTANDGTLLTSQATGLLDERIPVGATVNALVNCDERTEPLRDPALFPPAQINESNERDESIEETSPAGLLNSSLPLSGTTESEPVASVLEAPAVGDVSPPGYIASQIFLPIVQQSDSRTAPTASTSAGPMATTSPTGDRPLLGAPICEYTYPWVSRHGMSEAAYQADAAKWDAAKYRPIAVSANGAGSAARFATLWLKDNKYSKNWSLRHDMNGDEYTQQFNELGQLGFVPRVIDLYGTTADPRYAAIWVKENTLTRSKHGLGLSQLQAEIDQAAADGLRPVWVSALGNPSDDAPIFGALWTRDAYTGTMRIGLTAADISGGGIRGLVGKGYRLAHLSGYETSEGLRYAGVWIKDSDCLDARWEGFRDQSSTQYQVKAAAQRTVSSVKTIAAAAITVSQKELGGTFRIARISLRHDFGSGQAAELSRIQGEVANQFNHGDLLILQVEPNHLVRVEGRENGNLQLRPWVVAGAFGQNFMLDNYQYRLVLQYNSELQRWVELQRNELSPDYYWPASIDEFFVNGERRYNSVWRAGPTDRRWQINGVPSGSDPLGAFDLAMQTYMQRRNIPNGALAITVDGRTVLERGYTWEPRARPAITPDASFRLASVSKPLTAIGILALVQQGKLALDTKLYQIPGFEAVLKSTLWADSRIRAVTVRQLLHHQGGWDRAQTADPMLDDWTVCAFTNPNQLPTTRSTILDYIRTVELDHEPGNAYAYANVGYMILGLVIETVSGQDYEEFIQANVFKPVGATNAALGSNAGSAKNEVRYYTPINAMGPSRLGLINFVPANWQVCNWQQAAQLSTSYGGGHNIEPMDAHGGWIASAGDLVKVMAGVEDGTLLNEATRSQLWSRPAERARRIGALDSDDWSYNDFTRQARINSNSFRFIPIDKVGDILMVGRGLEKFKQIKMELNKAGEGYDLRMIYPTESGKWATLTTATNALSDGTAGFTQNGTITFTPPDDWRPIVISSLDPYPKYYLWIYSITTPTSSAIFDRITPNGESSYGLGWSINNEVEANLAYVKLVGRPTVGITIVGEKSKASAQLTNIVSGATPLAGTFVLTSVVGGPFYKGEKLLFGNTVIAEAADREWSTISAASHSGLLWGTTAYIQHRSSNVNWAILFNQDAAYDPYWYMPYDGTITGEIDRLVNLANSKDSWPND